MIIKYVQTKFEELILIIKCDIHVKNFFVKIQIFQFLALPHYTL